MWKHLLNKPKICFRHGLIPYCLLTVMRLSEFFLGLLFLMSSGFGLKVCPAGFLVSSLCDKNQQLKLLLFLFMLLSWKREQSVFRRNSSCKMLKRNSFLIVAFAPKDIIITVVYHYVRPGQHGEAATLSQPLITVSCYCRLSLFRKVHYDVETMQLHHKLLIKFLMCSEFRPSAYFIMINNNLFLPLSDCLCDLLLYELLISISYFTQLCSASKCCYSLMCPDRCILSILL